MIGVEPNETKEAFWGSETMKEAIISVNGIRLSDGQSMALRVAVESFVMTLSSDGLGDDQMGKLLADGYMSRLEEIRDYFHRNRDS